MSDPTMADVRGALEASGLPVLHSGYSLRFPNSPLIFRMDSGYKVVALYCGDFKEEFISETDKKIFAIAAIFDIERSDFGIKTSRGKYVTDFSSRSSEKKWISIP
ncbi:hypothetical protein SBP1_gp082 [Vibrio virus vB_VspP_SBP1]|uniref:Uncharacterized protein n=1 Tax=Vibrio virus vB_VspP_SBP1 TaxID=2500581 RepID=A0A3T0IIT5_9CAUD|nr:hypothetical protein KNU36_gp047 [Vibrio virus vB_VspP_SBP1]AZU99674.1 hypothetical protein SBP1_gp082 [Vibrio virus vB_VspP_SBP1]